MQEIIKLLKNDKIEINFNKNPIKMDLFLSFVKVPTEINREHLGYSNGWTQKVNKEYNLIIGGGVVGGIEYLDRLQFGKNLQNRFNNYVNPFYLFEILTEEGKLFFKEYYKEDIEKIISEKTEKIKYIKLQIENERQLLTEAEKLIK